MRNVGIKRAKNNFSKLIDAVAHGEEIIIVKTGVPVAKLVPAISHKPKLKFGTLKRKMTIPDDFDELFSDEIINLFESE